MSKSVIINKEATLEEQYVSFQNQIFSLLDLNDNLISNLSNFCAALKQTLDKISWVGFYFFDGEKLFLGPFQGKVACTNISIGKGVCGTAAKEKKTIVVTDVTKFHNHIFCDANSKSEIVIPIVKEDELIGVLDIDSTVINSFNKTDKKYLEKLCGYLANHIFNNSRISF